MVRDHLSMRYWPILINFDRFITLWDVRAVVERSAHETWTPFFRPLGGVSMLLRIVQRDGFQLRCTFGII